MAESPLTDHARFEEDPLYRNCAREAKFILGLWLCCFLYTVTYCYLYGYLVHEPLPGSTGPGVAKLVGPLEPFNRDPQSLTYPLGLGIPDWVFYGIVLPWGFSVVASFWYALVMFSDDDLSDPNEGSLEQDEGDGAGEERGK